MGDLEDTEPSDLHHVNTVRQIIRRMRVSSCNMQILCKCYRESICYKNKE